MSTTVATPELKTSRIPPLEQGDHLTRDEFERRYEAMPHVKKAELIEGVVYMSSPVNHRNHGHPHSEVVGWLVNYAAYTSSVETGDNSTVRLDLDNEPQPDVFLRVLPDSGGQTRDSEEGYVEGAPEFIAEVAASSASYDNHEKKRAYQRNGVREYLIWFTLEERVEWWVLEKGEFQPIQPDDDGLLRSRTFPGLWLDPTALVARDFARVLDVVRQGVESPEHAEFVGKK